MEDNKDDIGKNLYSLGFRICYCVWWAFNQPSATEPKVEIREDTVWGTGSRQHAKR